MEYSNATAFKHDLQNELIGVEYPGIVKNQENMIKSLGGLTAISSVLSSDKRRLELKFRPENIYCKSAYGDKLETTGMLLKLKIRRPKNKNKEAIIDSVEIMGRIRSMVKFQSLCDYQLLPIAKNKEGKSEYIYKDLMPEGLLKPEWLSEGNDVPYFLPPFSFSRIDTTQVNIFKKETLAEQYSDEIGTGRTRCRRTKHGIYFAFNFTDPIPSEPNKLAIDMLNTKVISQEAKETLKDAFRRRPIWTKAALRYELDLDHNDIRFILPSLAFYFTTGPWRITWVRFGYDPRKIFESRHYQILDFRVRQIGGMHTQVQARRAYSLSKPSSSKAPLKPILSQGLDSSDSGPAKNATYSTRFEMNTLPTMRITFYQYCDVHVPKIQQMIDKIPTPMTGAVCNEKTGWLPPGFDDQCRDILTEIVIVNFKTVKEDDVFDLNEDEFNSDNDEENSGSSSEEEEQEDETMDD